MMFKQGQARDGRLEVDGTGVILEAWASQLCGYDITADIFPDEDFVMLLDERFNKWLYDGDEFCNFDETNLLPILEVGYAWDYWDTGRTGVAGAVIANHPEAADLVCVKASVGTLMLAREGNDKDIEFLKRFFGEKNVGHIHAICDAHEATPYGDDDGRMFCQGFLRDGLLHVKGFGADIDGGTITPSSHFREIFSEEFADEMEKRFVAEYSKHHFDKMDVAWILDKVFHAEDGESGWAGSVGAILDQFPETRNLVCVRDIDGHRHMFAREGNKEDVAVLKDVFARIYESGEDARIYEGRRVAGVLYEHDAICELSVDDDGELVFPPMDHAPIDEQEPTPTIWDY